jgi:hypothetical protein
MPVRTQLTVAQQKQVEKLDYNDKQRAEMSSSRQPIWNPIFTSY